MRTFIKRIWEKRVFYMVFWFIAVILLSELVVNITHIIAMFN